MSKVQLPRIELQPEPRCTLACRHCQHSSPERAAAGEPPADAKILAGHLARLDTFAAWPFLFVGGGEPFLVRDLAGWIDAVNTGPHRRPVHVITNGFWLLRRDWRAFAAPVLSRLAALIVSRYPVYVDRIGVAGWDARLDMLRADFPALHLTSFHPSDPTTLDFVSNEFHDAPLPVPAPSPCAMKFCVQLLPSGRLARCPYGLSPHLIPRATGAFRSTYAATGYYDLARLPEGLAEWSAGDSFAACNFCGLATGHTRAEAWSTA